MITDKDLKLMYHSDTGKNNTNRYIISCCDGSEDSVCDATITNEDTRITDTEITTYSDEYVLFLENKLLEYLNKD